MNHRLLLGLTLTVTLVGCEREPQPGMRAGDPESPATAPPAAPAPDAGLATGETVQVQMINREGQTIGEAQLAETGDGVRIAIQVSNLPPGSKGFHVHEVGACDPPSFQSAGAHFAPMGREHGFENPAGPHAGDLRNLPVREDGRADTTVVARELTLRPGQANSLVHEGGTSLLIHENPDDYSTDPSGNSGDRIACGVISPR